MQSARTLYSRLQMGGFHADHSLLILVLPGHRKAHMRAMATRARTVPIEMKIGDGAVGR